MMTFSRFSEDVSEEELNPRKYGLKNLEGKKKRIWSYQYGSFTWQVVAGESSFAISIGCLNKFNNCLSKKVL